MYKFLLVTIVVCASSLIACGDDPPGNGGIITTNNNNGTGDAGNNTSNNATTDDMGMSDAGGNTTADGGTQTDAGMDAGIGECDLVTCEPSQICVEGMCIDRLPCDEALDAGTLSNDTPVSVTGSFLTTGSDQTTSSCGEDGQLEQLVRFEITERAEVSWDVDWDGQFDGLVALQSECDDVSTEVTCSDVEFGSAVLEPGVYFLVLEVRLGNAGGFTAELTSGPPPTCTIGSATCSGDDREICSDGFATTTESCPTTCDSGSCGGDSCSDAITVTAPGGTFSGTGRAMTSNLNYAGNTDCAQLGGMSTATPGYDVVFFLPNLLPGQVVSIDAESNDANVNDIFIQQTCGASNQCSASYQNSEAPDFVVQSGGDYFVIIEKRQVSNAPFEYRIAIQ